MLPIAHALNEPVLDWVEMNVIDMSLKIVLVANRVFPKSSLPQRQIAVWSADNINSGIKQRGAEVSLDPSPSTRKVGISRRQREDRMKMIR